MKDTVGTELITRVDVQSDSLGDLADASTDVDAPEQLELPAPPKVHAPTPEELALIQAKVSHKEQSQSAAHTQKSKRQLVHKVLDAPQATLTKAWEKSTKLQAKAADEDVEQLGGQLQNIMSELNGPDSQAKAEDADVQETKTVAKEQTKQVVEQASASEDEADSGDDAAMEKEVGKPQKDDSENVVDGAMAYIRTRLAAEEHKSLRLRQLLSQSVRGNRNMRQKIEQLRKQLTEGAALQKSLRTVASQKVSQEEAQLAKQTQRADTVTKQLQNATRAAKIGEKAMKFLGMKLKYSKSQVAALLLNLANASQQNKDLRRHLDIANSTAVAESTQLGEARRKLSAEETELAETKAKLQKIETEKKAEDEQLKTLDRQKDFLEQRQVSAQKRDQILHKENHLLKKQVAKEIQREEQLREMWSKESEAFTWQLRAERANASESLSDLEKARSEFRDLRQRVQKLRERASHGEQSRHKAEEAANRAQFALAEAEAENKQLKGSVPWLEAEVDRQRQSAQNASKAAQQALKERDTVKAILGEAQKSIVQLQGQYADALQALVVAQAGGSDASKAQAQAQAPTNTIQQFAGLGANPLGAPPPVASPVGFPAAAGALSQLVNVEHNDAQGGSSLLELRRDSKALGTIMDTPQAAPTGRVDLSKDSGGLGALLRGMNAAR